MVTNVTKTSEKGGSLWTKTDIQQIALARAADIRAIVISFTLAHATPSVVLGFAGDGLQDSGIRLALAAWIILGSLWSVAFMDDAIQDLNMAFRDMEGFMETSMGKRLEKMPVTAFRVANVVIVPPIVIAEMMAIY